MTATRAAEPLKVLFVGNSFTYGPPPYDRDDQLQLNNLPRLFKLVAKSMGKDVLIAEDTIGGCTLHMHRISSNPEACVSEFCKVVDNARVSAADACTVIPSVPVAPSSHSCPQLLTRQPYGPWDVVVLQEAALLPTVSAAREQMMFPAMREYAAVLKRLGASVVRERPPVIATYMTWSYYQGQLGCPHSLAGCYPLGTLAEMAECPASSAYPAKVGTSACQGYSIARAYAETLVNGADVLVPAGLAWQMARGSPAIPDGCREAVDAEYESAGHLAGLGLPLLPQDPTDARWASDLDAQRLFRDLGPAYNSSYCTDDCHIDLHASIEGMYLNALVFYATLFRESPVGAAAPDGVAVVDGMVLPALRNMEEAVSLQRLARDTVMPHLELWWGESPVLV